MKGTGRRKERSDRNSVKPGVPTRRWQTGFGPTRSHMSTKSARMRRRERGFGPPHGHRGDFPISEPPEPGGFLILNFTRLAPIAKLVFAVDWKVKLSAIDNLAGLQHSRLHFPFSRRLSVASRL